MSAFVAGRNHILLSKNALQFTYINAKFQKFSVGGPRTPNTRTGTTREMVAEVEERRDGEDAREGGMGGDGRRPIQERT